MLVDFITVRCALKPEMWYFCCPDDNILHSGADTFFYWYFASYVLQLRTCINIILYGFFFLIAAGQ